MIEAGRADRLFERHRFDEDVVRLCVRWYLGSGFSLRDLVQMTTDRGLAVAHTTIMRWVRRCAPGARRCGGFPRTAADAGNWRIEESVLKIRGERQSLYRAVDRTTGETVDFWLGAVHDLPRAQAFFGASLRSEPSPKTISDGEVAWPSVPGRQKNGRQAMAPCREAAFIDASEKAPIRADGRLASEAAHR